MLGITKYKFISFVFNLIHRRVYLVILNKDEPTYKELVDINKESEDTIKELNNTLDSYRENNIEFRALCKLVKKLYNDDIECRCKIKEQAAEIKALKEKIKSGKCKKGVI